MSAFWNIENLILPAARKLAVRHTRFVCLTASFLATGGFVKLFHKIPWFLHDYSGLYFLKVPCFFPCMELFFRDFPWFPELVGPLLKGHIWLDIKGQLNLQKHFETLSDLNGSDVRN